MLSDLSHQRYFCLIYVCFDVGTISLLLALSSLFVSVDYEDLELLDALETLADTRPTAVDDDSILGSQTSRSIPVRCHLEEPLGDQYTSDEEDEKWHDKTLIAEEV